MNKILIISLISIILLSSCDINLFKNKCNCINVDISNRQNIINKLASNSTHILIYDTFSIQLDYF